MFRRLQRARNSWACDKAQNLIHSGKFLEAKEVLLSEEFIDEFGRYSKILCAYCLLRLRRKEAAGELYLSVAKLETQDRAIRSEDDHRFTISYCEVMAEFCFLATSDPTDLSNRIASLAKMPVSRRVKKMFPLPIVSLPIFRGTS